MSHVAAEQHHDPVSNDDFSAVLPNNDGILLVRPLDRHGARDRKCMLYKLLLADSGHYILPIHRFEDRADKYEQSYLRKALQKYLDETLYGGTWTTDQQAAPATFHNEFEQEVPLYIKDQRRCRDSSQHERDKIPTRP